MEEMLESIFHLQKKVMPVDDSNQDQDLVQEDADQDLVQDLEIEDAEDVPEVGQDLEIEDVEDDQDLNPSQDLGQDQDLGEDQREIGLGLEVKIEGEEDLGLEVGEEVEVR